jgi:hypothetical protein
VVTVYTGINDQNSESKSIFKKEPGPLVLKVYGGNMWGMAAEAYHIAVR